MILQFKVCLLDFVRNDLSDLAADRDIQDARLFDPRVREIFFLAETDLVIEQDDIFAFDPVEDIFFLFATIGWSTLAKLELDC